jgi:hypothetical protein
MVHMKTTMDIPDALFRRAKIAAIERGTSLKSLVLAALEEHLERPTPTAAHPDRPRWAERRLLPGYRSLLETGSLRGGTDSTRSISEEREGR